MTNQITKQSPITLVELPPTQFGKLGGEPGYDIYSRSMRTPRALPVLEGVLRADGWKNTKCSNDFRDIFSSDVVLASHLSRTAPQTHELLELFKLNKTNPNAKAIVGGCDVSFRIEDALRHADIAVLREGERTISELMERLREDPENLDDIKGIAYKKGEEIIITSERPLLTGKELSQLPHHYYNHEAKKNIQTVSIETSRGCPNDCDFCTVTELYGKTHREKSIDYVIGELYRTKDMGKFNFFIDDNFVVPSKTGVERSKGLLRAIADQDLNKKPGLAQVTIKLAEKPEVMGLMKNAGIKYLFVGIESINDETLKDIGKPYTAAQNEEAIKTLKNNGFWVHGMMMAGGKGDTPKTLRDTVSWMKENLDSMQLFSITPIPGTSLYDRVEEEGRIITKDWSLYDGHHVLVRPKNISPESFSPYELQTTIFDAYKDFYSVKSSLKRLKRSPNKLLSSILLAQTPGAINRIIKAPQTQAHLDFLKSVS